MKTCTKCGETKPLDQFGKHAAHSDGLRSECKACTAAYRAANNAKVNARTVAWRKANPDKIKAYSSAYYAANAEKRKAYSSARKAANPAVYAAYNAKRQAAKLQATPAWANEFFISEAYDLAKRRTKAFGFSWHVDHIVPLRSKLVCGLHTEANLQVIPGKENISKNNHHWPDMP